jgi:hypothetical protein
LGEGGRENCFTAPTWASLAYTWVDCGGYKETLRLRRLEETYGGCGLVGLELAEVEVLDEVYWFGQFDLYSFQSILQDLPL